MKQVTNSGCFDSRHLGISDVGPQLVMFVLLELVDCCSSTLMLFQIQAAVTREIDSNRL